jgi:hypothetical protein
MTPALARLSLALPSKARHALTAAIGFHGAAVIQSALAYEPGLEKIRRPLVVALVRTAGYDLVLARLGCDAIELMRDLAEMTPVHVGGRGVIARAVAGDPS